MCEELSQGVVFFTEVFFVEGNNSKTNSFPEKNASVNPLQARHARDVCKNKNERFF